ncbi:MAG: COX15/CtaA family protein, partial [Thermoleophilia bacterium]|nr:COX15/CtaA family protein [Thermoleophilia bacterium]
PRGRRHVLRDYRVSLTTHRRIADTSLVLLWLIVVTGATVRLTQSGLGCPDWPSCHGSHPVPQLSYHPLIEFANRMVTTPVLLASLATWWSARRLAVRRPDLRRFSGLVVLGVLAQAVIGGISVRLHLTPVMVSIHFLVSMLILMAASWVSFAARRPGVVRLRVQERNLGGTTRTGAGTAAMTRAAVIVMLTCAATVIVFGVLTTASGPHSGGLPEQNVQRFGDGGLMVMLHARLGFTFFAIAVGLTLWHRRTRAGARDMTLLTALTVVQIALGEYQYRNGLPWRIVLAHVATATALWIVTCMIAWNSLSKPAAVPHDGDRVILPTPDRSISSAV